MKCPDCDGKGTIEEACGECDGSGEGRADDTTCLACAGDGTENETCYLCEGTGEYTPLCNNCDCEITEDLFNNSGLCESCYKELDNE